MFDIGAAELLVIAIVAILVIGPKDMPLALRTAGRWMGKIRRVSNHFRTGLDAMIREAEMEDMEKKWQDRNAAIMAKHPEAEKDEPVMRPLPPNAPEIGRPEDGAAKGQDVAEMPDDPATKREA